MGFSSVEALLAASIFVLLVTALVGAYLYGQEATAFAGNRARAVLLAEEGMEAVRNIRDESFSNLTDGAYGLTTTGNQWSLAGVSEVIDVFTRQIAISSVDANRKDVSVNVTWQQNPQRSGLVTVAGRLTNWSGGAPAPMSCNNYAVQQGYMAGTCRQNARQCTRNGEVHLPSGDIYCLGGPSADTCCALP